MPTTATGTAYTITTTTTTGHGTALYAVADKHAADSGIPTILYAHGAGGGYNQFATFGAWSGLRDWIIDNGGAWVEGGGGITDTSGSEAWGNQEAREAYVAYLNWAATQISVGPVVPLGRSMGGLVAVWLYLLSPIASQCVGLIENSGVQTLFEGVEGTGNANLMPTGQYFSGSRRAFNVTTYTELKTAAAAYDPMQYPDTLWAGKNVLQLMGDADTAVPWTPRGGAPLRERYAGKTAIDLLHTRVGGDHSAANGSYLETSAMASFLTQVAFASAPPIDPPMFYRRLGHWLYQGGERYAMHPNRVA